MAQTSVSSTSLFVPRVSNSPWSNYKKPISALNRIKSLSSKDGNSEKIFRLQGAARSYSLYSCLGTRLLSLALIYLCMNWSDSSLNSNSIIGKTFAFKPDFRVHAKGGNSGKANILRSSDNKMVGGSSGVHLAQSTVMRSISQPPPLGRDHLPTTTRGYSWTCHKSLESNSKKGLLSEKNVLLLASVWDLGSNPYFLS